MHYVEITASVPARDADLACDALRAATGADPWIDVPFVQPDLESDAIRTEGLASVRAYLSSGDADALTASAERALAAAGLPAVIERRDVAEEDWAESWKEHFHVERFGERIVVVPSWRTYEARPRDVILTLDPGMAFGTGQHETTRMCLEALERAVSPGARVLDVGCGSGILSIAAAKLGAREVYAVDVDENCVRITQVNAALNGVSGAVHAAVGSLGDEWPPAAAFSSDATPATPVRNFDVIVANIIARVIIELTSPLVDALADAGVLIASGIIGEREGEVIDALIVAGARITSIRAMRDWRCIEAARA